MKINQKYAVLLCGEVSDYTLLSSFGNDELGAGLEAGREKAERAARKSLSAWRETYYTSHQLAIGVIEDRGDGSFKIDCVLREG